MTLDRTEIHRLRDRLRILSETTTAFADATTDYPRLIATISTRLAEVVGDTCAVFLLSDDGKSLAPTAIHSASADAADEVKRFLARAPLVLGEHPAAKHVIESGEPFVVRKMDPDAMRSQTTSSYVEHIEKRKEHSLLVVALKENGRSTGILSLSRHRSTSPSFDDDDLVLAQMLATHAALAITNARAYIDAQSARLAMLDTGDALRRTRWRLMRIVESGLLGLIVARLDGRVIEINDTLLRMVGYERDEVLASGFAWKDLTPPEYRELDARAVGQLRATGVSTLREKSYRRKDGSLVPVLAGSAMLDGGNEVISFILDLTDRKRAEAENERLHQQHYAEARLAGIVESTDDAIIGKTLDGIVTSWNPGAERLFGYTADDMIGESITILLPPGETTEEERILARLRRGETDHFDGVRRKKNGELVEVSITSSPLVDAKGNLIGASKVARDITERKRAERELARAKETAEAVSRELESFSYSVAHDLRAPLRGINGFAQMLIDDHAKDLTDEGREWLGEITASARRMGELIDALLSLSRLTRSTLERSDVDLSAMARAAMDRLRKTDPDRDVAFVVQDGLHAQADSVLVQNLVDNLIGNAWKFTTKSSSPRIEVGTTDTEHGRAFFVRDNGAGFDMAYAEKLFSPFQRLHTVTEFPGTGIGLASVQRIVHRHGGRIWARGAVNDGATFYFTLPARAKAEARS